MTARFDIGLSESRKRTTVQILLVFAVWTFLAAFSSSQTVVYLSQRGQPIVWRDMLTARFADWYTCALFTPLFFWMGRRYPIDRKSWRVMLPVTLAVTSVCVVLKYSVLVPIEHALGLYLGSSIGGELARNFANESMAFWAVIGIVHAFEFNRRYREREVAASDLRARLSEAQLEALRSQIHPHFLFNTLHGISTLMHRDVDAADSMLTRLSELLRLTMQHRGQDEIPLRDELALVGQYVEIMRVRFRDRLIVNHTIDPKSLDALVPQFILQPLLENAFDHGIARTPGPGSIAISVQIVGPKLEISISDNGLHVNGYDAGAKKHGIGLANTRRRLEQLYGPEQSMSLEKLPDRGTRVVVAIPLHASAQSPLATTSVA
ncbi:MAG TPA: histidine kinase [Gemmatimonadaceae bacterium]|nr:histidine kinase [Gemmatimonadaceae bacterium]